VVRLAGDTVEKERTYLRTSDIARAVGVHPNTVRLYEEWGFIPPVPRTRSGYRMYSLEHLEVMRLARTALHHPYPGGKGPVLELVARAVEGDLEGALRVAHEYVEQIGVERAHAEAAADLLEGWASGALPEGPPKQLRISEMARLLGATRDALRNWERNGLVRVPQHPGNRYRLYGPAEVNRLRVIRVLRSAGYSTMAILRMLLQLDSGTRADLRRVLETPGPEEDVWTCADRWLTTLSEQEARARQVTEQLEAMIARRG
jgi:DNA-binding transcriptional MerR regulator